MYKAIEYFKDLKDGGYKYHAGDVFPRQGYKPSASRIAELLSANNKRGRAVIAKVIEAEVPVKQAEPVKAAEPVEEKPKRRRSKKNA